MSSSNVRPKWWQLYLIFPLLIALFALDSQLKIPTGWHQVVQIGILLLVYGLIHLWLKANSSALSKMDQKQYRSTFTVIQIPPEQSSNADNEEGSMFQLPDSEIKGVLSDTFEMDYIDAKSVSVDETSEDAKKE